MAAQEGIITIPISAQLTSNGYGGVADAEQIAYSYKTENDITLIDKSIKDKIDEIEQQLENIDIDEIDSSKVIFRSTYQGEEVETPLNEILTTISTDSLNDAVASAQGSAQQASQALGQIEIKKQSIETSIGTVTDKIDTVTPKLNSLEETAALLKTVFDADAQFVIISQQDYDSLVEKSPNTIYFCYDS